MAFYLHDDTPAKPGEKHGARGPTHCGTYRGTFDYDYQLEMWLEDMAADYPMVVRIESDGGREWQREGSRFREVRRRLEAKVCRRCGRRFEEWLPPILGVVPLNPQPDPDCCRACQPKGSPFREEPPKDPAPAVEGGLPNPHELRSPSSDDRGNQRK